MGRLMKYELLSGTRLFIPLWLGTLILSLVNRFTIRPGTLINPNPVEKFLVGLAMTAYVVALIAICVLSLIYIVYRFYQSTMKEEGYLTFTLPLGIDSILWAKALSGMIIMIGSAVVCFLSLFVVASRREFLQAFVNIQWPERTVDAVLIPVMFILMILSTCLNNIFHMYLSMGFGQLAQKHKLGASVLAYVVINVVLSTVMSLVIIPLLSYSAPTGMPAWISGPLHSMWVILLGLTLFNLLLTVIFYFPTRYIFKKKLNLE